MTTRPGYIKDGSGNWIQIGPAVPVGSTVYYQASEPTSPSTGDIWIDSDYDVPSVDSSQFLRWRKTASGSETSLSGNDDTGLSLSYTPGYEQVYLNGVLLVRSQDYTATTGTTITGLTALAASDVVEVFSVLARVVGDVYTQAQADNKYSLQTTTGMVLIASSTFTTSSTLSINNCFSSTYSNYKIIAKFDTPSADNYFRLRLRASGTDSSASYFGNQVIVGNYSSAGVYQDNNAASQGLFDCDASTTGACYNTTIDIQSPYEAKWTTYNLSSNGTSQDSNYTRSYVGGGQHRSTTQYDGFTLFPDAGTINGTIKVYGYK